MSQGGGSLGYDLLSPTLLARKEEYKAEVDRDERLAAQLVRRMANQHDCPSAPSFWRIGDVRSETYWAAEPMIVGPPCPHPEHRRDVDFMRHCLEVLGLPLRRPEMERDDYAPVGGWAEQEVHVDWVCTESEFDELRAILLNAADFSPYVRKLRDEGKLTGTHEGEER